MGCKIIHGENFTAIQCGNPTDHKCDSKGPGVLLLNDSPYEVEDNEENLKKYEGLINGGSVNCSICGRSAFQNMRWM